MVQSKLTALVAGAARECKPAGWAAAAGRERQQQQARAAEDGNKPLLPASTCPRCDGRVLRSCAAEACELEMAGLQNPEFGVLPLSETMPQCNVVAKQCSRGGMELAKRVSAISPPFHLATRAHAFPARPQCVFAISVRVNID